MIILMLKIGFVLACLIYASYTDLKTRKVPNKLWLVMLVSLPFFIIIEQIHLIPLFISLLCCSIFSYLFFRLGYWGAADAKAVILLSLYFPYFLSSLPLVIWVILIASIVGVIIYWKDLIGFNLRNKHPFMPTLTIGFISTTMLLFA